MPKYGPKNFIFQSESQRRVRQWHFSLSQIFAIAGFSTVIIGAILFFTAEVFTQWVYHNKLREIQSEYSSIYTTLNYLQGEVENLDNRMEEIVEKDQAVRSYADLPPIDQDVRSLGIGGVPAERSPELDDQLPVIKSRISNLESNIKQLSREVKLELASYEDIYDKVKIDSEKLKHIPSIRPVIGGYLNSNFGYRKDPLDGKRRFHHGLDITVGDGAPVLAPADGVVKEARIRGGYGKYIKIDHGYGYQTLFLHLSKINVKKGEKVRRGDVIGKTGRTGRVSGPHLHYEVHYYGTPQDPLDYFFTGYFK
ncbi:MAG: M23 family metallopeptidase [Fidelibacterota bacterium]